MDKSLCTEKPFGLFNKAEAHISLVISLFTSENCRTGDKPNKGICLWATQAVEKLLKGFIIYNNYKVGKIYNLDCLLETTKKIDPSFSDIANECLLLNGFTAVYHYYYRQPFTKKESIQVVKALKKISKFPPINAMRDIFNKNVEYHKASDDIWNRIFEQDKIPPF